MKLPGTLIKGRDSATAGNGRWIFQEPTQCFTDQRLFFTPDFWRPVIDSKPIQVLNPAA